MKKTLLLLPALMLAGCQMLNYQEPTGEDTAAVVFTGNEAAQPVVCVPGRGFKDTKISLAVKPWDTNAFNELFKTMRKAEQVPVTVAAAQMPMPRAWVTPAIAPARWPPCRVWRVTTARLMPGAMAPRAQMLASKSQSWKGSIQGLVMRKADTLAGCHDRLKRCQDASVE